MTIRDKAAVVGVGATPYFKRGGSLPETELSMACTAILGALDDAGLKARDLDGFALYASSCDPAVVGATLGLDEVRFAVTLTSGGGGSAGALGVAAAAIYSGLAETCVCLMTLQQAKRRLGGTVPTGASAPQMSAGPYGSSGDSSSIFRAVSGLRGPGHNYSLIAMRHMHLYGTKREHFAEICISQRENAIRRPTSLRRDRLTLDDYFNAPMLSDPMCLFDYTMESDGAVAVILTSAERARDLRQRPVFVMGSTHGGAGRWGPGGHSYFQAPDDYFASAGNRTVSRRLYEMAGVGPADIDVALLYDHFSPLVLMQLEDYGFCKVGEGGDFVASGAIRYEGGSIPVNTHGGNLSEAYIIGMTHVREAVEQLRGVAVNQVKDAEIALVTGGPASLPVSGALLRRG
jgi:acetyl-CoA acetyltransferase